MKNNPIQLEYDINNNPHVVIEVNQTCNLSCKACYKKRNKYQKDLKKIINEIDFAYKNRKLDLITFAGGEPTLNNDLSKAISYVGKLKLNSIVLSNGFNINTGKLIDYKKAGLFMMYLHIDSMQNRPELKNKKNVREKDMNELRDILFSKISTHKIQCGLCVTLYKSKIKELKDIVDYVLSSRMIKGLLATCYADIKKILNEYKYKKELSNNSIILKTDLSYKFKNTKAQPSGKSIPEEIITNKEIENYLYKVFGITPDFYIPSNTNKNKHWLIYYLITINFSDGKYIIYSLSYRFRILFNKMNMFYKKKYGHSKFVVKLSRFKCVCLVFMSGLLSFNFKYFFNSIKFLTNLFKNGSKIYFKDLVFQQGPSIDKNGKLIYCKSCPDATVRNNHLVPLCLADFIEPVIDN